MARYPGAVWRPVAWAASLSRGGATPTAVVLHVTASEATSQHDYFASSRAACSHFHVARDGTVEQYADTSARSGAEAGSRRTISIETQGADTGGAWTAQQVTALTALVAWCHRTHGIPLRLMASSALTQHGVGWHRLGIDGTWPTGEMGGRLQRDPSGERWSTSRGKVCPGDARIRQVPGIVAAAGGATHVDKPAAPKPTTRDEVTVNVTIGKVRKGDRGPHVRLLQGVLNVHGAGVAAGVGVLDEDGSAGDKTIAALRAHQTAHRITVDGVAGADSWRTLLEDVPA